MPTPDLVRRAGFVPGEPRSEVDQGTAYVRYPATRSGRPWTVGLGVVLTTNAAEADTHWATLVRAAGDPATAAEGAAGRNRGRRGCP